MTFRPGLRIGDKYKLLRRLGAGALGQVWCARNEVVEREVAIKFIAPAWSVDEVAIDRFFADAKLSGKLRHPSIVELLDLGRTAAGVPYYVMELLEADKLDDVITRVESLPTGTSLRIVGELARAIAAAHEKKLPHLRIEPANVLLHRVVRGPKHVDVVPKLVDFGIAKLVQMAPARARRIDDLLGPIAYLSPEQTKENEIIDPRADVWALGILLYHCTVGAPPFAAKTIAELAAAHKSPCVAPNVVDPSIDATVSHLVMECLVPRERRPTAKRLADRCDELLRRFDDGWTDLASVLEIPEDREIGKLSALDPRAVEDDGATPSVRNVPVITKPIFDDARDKEGDAGPISSSSLEEIPPSSGESAPVSMREVQVVHPGPPPRRTGPPPTKSDVPMPLVTRVAPRTSQTIDPATSQLIAERLSKPQVEAAVLEDLENALLERVAAQRASLTSIEATHPTTNEAKTEPKKETRDVDDAAPTPIAPPAEEGIFASKPPIAAATPMWSTKSHDEDDEDQDTDIGNRTARSMAAMQPRRKTTSAIFIVLAVIAAGAIAFVVASPKHPDAPATPSAEPAPTLTMATTASTSPSTSPSTSAPTSATTTTLTEPGPTAQPTTSESAPPTNASNAATKPIATATTTSKPTSTPKPTPTPTATATAIVKTPPTKPTATTAPTKDPTYGVHDPGI